MTDIGATQVLDTPLTPEMAETRLAQLAQDPEFKARTDARDASAFAEANKLWRVAHGMAPEPVAPINAIDVMAETIGREQQIVQARADTLRADGFNETQIYAVLNGAPMSLAQRQYHERSVRVLKSDTAWVQRFLAGDLAARAEMRRHTAALTMPVGTQEQIDAWARAHAGRQPT